MFGKIGKSVGVGLKAFGAIIPALIRNLIGLGAVGAIAYGARLIYEPAGFLVAGALVLGGLLILSPRPAAK